MPVVELRCVTAFETGPAQPEGTQVGGCVRADHEIIDPGGSVLARIIKAYFRTGILEKQITTDWSKPVPWTLKLTGDRLTWTVAGGTVCSGQALDDPSMGVYYRATPNGRMGFVSRITPEGNVIHFSAIEVRRLK